MNGVEILHTYEVYATQAWVAVIGVLSFIGVLAFGIVLKFSTKNTFIWIGCIGMIVCALTCLGVGIIDRETNCLKEYSHIEYKVTIDDSVSMNEFLDKYEILDQEGKIYTVKERE